MELENKLNSIIDQLEKIKNLADPDIDIVRKQLDDIENKIIPKLDEEFNELSDRMYDEGDSNEAAKKFFDKIMNLFIHTNALIDTIREQLDLDYSDDGDEDCGLAMSLMDDGKDNDDYDIVLNEISKSALRAIGFDDKDPRTVGLMKTILVGISSNESDDVITERAFAQLAISGFMLPMDDINKLCKETREKCKSQLFGLQIAISTLMEYHCSAWEALSQISKFL